MQIQRIALAGLIVVALVDLALRQWVVGGLELAASAVLVGAMRLARKRRPAAAGSLTFATLAVLAAICLWIGQGPRDPAQLAFPGILVFAALLGNRRQFLLLLGFQLAVVALVVAGNLGGWHPTPATEVGLATFFNLAVILVVIAFAVWILAEDARRAMAALRAEHERLRQSMDRIDYLSQHDPVTGLPNQNLGRDRLEQAIAQAARSGSGYALVLLDLDHFQAVNDALGRDGADETLREVARRLTALLRGNDSVSRNRGDEFCVLLGGIPQGGEAAVIAEKILETLAVPVRINGLELAMSVSMGIVLIPSDGNDSDSLMRKASIAMGEAKAGGGNNFHFFLAGMNATAHQYLHLVAELRAALAQGHFVLHYQPQFHLASARVVGAEALIRWRHPERGLIPPGLFISAAERSGLIGEIGAWALQEACRQAMAWRVQGLELIMAVNLSPIQFRRKDLEATLVEALELSGLPPAALELELTESMLILDAEAVRERLHRLRETGVSFSIDDFGTGYSNLGYLKKFEVERLKIDQSFVRMLPENPQDEAIVRAIIQMAHALNLEVVAEGIETRAILERLQEMGCDMGQGFLWAPALPPEGFLDFVEAARADTTPTAHTVP